MGAPVSVRLDDDVQATLEGVATERGVGLSTLLRELATAEARRLRRQRIREQSRTVAAYIATCPDAEAFHHDWNTPTPPEGGGGAA